MSTISQIAAGPWLEYSMYTLENRAIPSMIDGLKPGEVADIVIDPAQRFQRMAGFGRRCGGGQIGHFALKVILVTAACSGP